MDPLNLLFVLTLVVLAAGAVAEYRGVDVEDLALRSLDRLRDRLARDDQDDVEQADRTGDRRGSRRDQVPADRSRRDRDHSERPERERDRPRERVTPDPTDGSRRRGTTQETAASAVSDVSTDGGQTATGATGSCPWSRQPPVRPLDPTALRSEQDVDPEDVADQVADAVGDAVGETVADVLSDELGGSDQ